MELHQVFRLDLVTALQPVDFLVGQCRQQKVTVGCEAQNCQPAFRRATAVLGEVGIEVFLAQHTVHGFGHGRALARAQAELAEITRQHHVRRVVKFENVLDELGTTVE